ncbi:MAG: thioredoxin domain-containing protein, partial [Pseudomonadota bacterium]
VGFFTFRSVQAMQFERDLTRIGQGKPAVVQVHDPQCPTCNALQNQTRKAMKQFGECDLLFLVADITQPAGGALARQYGVPHVTLLLFDGQGGLQQTLHGLRDRSELEVILAAHFREYGSRRS